MKKFIAMLITLCLLCCEVYAFADVPDVSKMTENELLETYFLVKQEIQNRAAEAEKDDILFLNDMVEIKRNGEPYIEGKYACFPVIVSNKSEQKFRIDSINGIVNDWTVNINIFEPHIEPHTKKKSEIYFAHEKADCNSIEDVEYLKFSIQLSMEDGQQIVFGPFVMAP